MDNFNLKGHLTINDLLKYENEIKNKYKKDLITKTAQKITIRAHPDEYFQKNEKTNKLNFQEKKKNLCTK